MNVYEMILIFFLIICMVVLAEDSIYSMCHSNELTKLISIVIRIKVFRFSFAPFRCRFVENSHFYFNLTADKMEFK